MTNNRRENPRRFNPSAGFVYENAGGGRYLCQYALETGCTAWMQNTASGWTCLAHGIVRYEDGTIEWDYSTGGHFEKATEPAVIDLVRRQRSMVNAMLCCMI